MPVSEAIGNAVLDYLCRGTPMPSPPTAVHVSLHTADPGATGASEMAGGLYARSTNAIASFAAASGKANTSNASITVTAAAATATHWGLWTASSGGSFLVGGTLSPSVVCSNGLAVVIPSGDLDQTIT